MLTQRCRVQPTDLSCIFQRRYTADLYPRRPGKLLYCDCLTRRRISLKIAAVDLIAGLEIFHRCQVDCALEDLRKVRSEEHTSELQSRGHLVCRLLLEKKTKIETQTTKKNQQKTRDEHSAPEQDSSSRT